MSVESNTFDYGISDDYRFSDGELNNIVYLTCKYTVQWPMRKVDLEVCLTMAGGKEEIVGNKGLENLVQHTCEFLWDHMCGETDEFSPDDLVDHINPILRHWFENTTFDERNSIE